EPMIVTWAWSPRMLIPAPSPALVLLVTVVLRMLIWLWPWLASSMLMPPPDPLTFVFWAKTHLLINNALFKNPPQSKPAPSCAKLGGGGKGWVLRPKRTVTSNKEKLTG